MDIDFKLIESIKYHKHTGYYLLTEHLQRLKNSASLFNFVYDEQILKRELHHVSSVLADKISYKVRVILSKNGTLDINYATIDTSQHQHMRIIMLYENERVNYTNRLLQHKTIDSSVRKFYDQVMLAYDHRYADVIFMNQDNVITEGSKVNIFIQCKGKIITPATCCGLLPGTMRNKLLENNPLIEQTCLYKKDLYQAERIWITNSVRGIEEVKINGGTLRYT